MNTEETQKRHEIIKFLANIPGRHSTNGICRLHYTKAGRLVVTGQQIDLLDLLLWVDKNPLTQFRAVKPPVEDGENTKKEENKEEDYEPGSIFNHLFSEKGEVL